MIITGSKEFIKERKKYVGTSNCFVIILPLLFAGGNAKLCVNWKKQLELIYVMGYNNGCIIDNLQGRV